MSRCCRETIVYQSMQSRMVSFCVVNPGPCMYRHSNPISVLLFPQIEPTQLRSASEEVEEIRSVRQRHGAELSAPRMRRCDVRRVLH